MFLKFFKPTINSVRFKKKIVLFFYKNCLSVFFSNLKSFFFKKNFNKNKFLENRNKKYIDDLDVTTLNSFIIFKVRFFSYTNLLYGYCFSTDGSVSIKPLPYGFSSKILKQSLFFCEDIFGLKNNLFFSKIGDLFFFVKSNNSVYAASAGTYCTVLHVGRFNKYILIMLPSKNKKTIHLNSGGIVGRASNIFSKYQIYSSFGQKKIIKKHSVHVRGIAMNPVDHPNGGRSKIKQPLKTRYGLIAKRGK